MIATTVEANIVTSDSSIPSFNTTRGYVQKSISIEIESYSTTSGLYDERITPLISLDFCQMAKFAFDLALT